MRRVDCLTGKTGDRAVPLPITFLGLKPEHLGKAQLVDTLGGVVLFKGRQEPLIQLRGTTVILLTPPGPSGAVERSSDLEGELGPVRDLEKSGLGIRPPSLILVGARQKRVAWIPIGSLNPRSARSSTLMATAASPASRRNRPSRITASRA